MKICYFDAFSGISGDMTVGALLDAGADFSALEQALGSLGLDAGFRVDKTKRKGIAASKFSVQFAENKKHRHLPQIEKMIRAAALSERAKDNALAVFARLGSAEAKSHDVPIERVHFHEVGAVDSICDVVGACVALDLLGVEEIHSSKINVGSGTVNTEHGVLPVPAPATTELLKNSPVYAAGPETELTTPTGAALVTTLAKTFGPMPSLRILSQGFGAGDKEFSQQANVLRVVIGESTAASEATIVAVLEASIDDSSPQVLGYAMECLLESGALDATMTPILMKKNRPGTLLSVICAPDAAHQLAQVIFRETTTLGIRVQQAERYVLERQFASVETSYGTVRVKYTDEGSFAPEYEDCRKLASSRNVPLRLVLAEASEAFRRQRGTHTV